MKIQLSRSVVVADTMTRYALAQLMREEGFKNFHLLEINFKFRRLLPLPPQKKSVRVSGRVWLAWSEFGTGQFAFWGEMSMVEDDHEKNPAGWKPDHVYLELLRSDFRQLLRVLDAPYALE